MLARSAFITLILVALAGCGSEMKRPEQLTRAQTLVEQAEKAGANRFAAAEVDTARNKIAAADKAVEKGNEEDATRLSSEAVLDAEYALARTQSGQAQKAAQEVGKGTETLKQEAERQPGAGATTQPVPSTQPLPSTQPAAPPQTTTPPPSTTQPQPYQPRN